MQLCCLCDFRTLQSTVYLLSLLSLFCVFFDPAFGCYTAINACVCQENRHEHKLGSPGGSGDGDRNNIIGTGTVTAETGRVREQRWWGWAGYGENIMGMGWE